MKWKTNVQQKFNIAKGWPFERLMNYKPLYCKIRARKKNGNTTNIRNEKNSPCRWY